MKLHTKPFQNRLWAFEYKSSYIFNSYKTHNIQCMDKPDM